MNATVVAKEVVQVLNTVLGPATDSPLPLHEPEITEIERATVDESLRSGWVSANGPFVTQFENQLRNITGAPYVVAMASGTAALHLALHALGIRPGDEVIVPALSFVATANAVSHCLATPHFVDSEPETFGLNPTALRKQLRSITVSRDGVTLNRQTGATIKAVVPMHAFGHPCRIREIVDIANEFGLPVIEDAAESLGSTTSNCHTGNFGHAGMLSFNGNKIATTGNGGAIVTKNEEFAERLRHLSTTAKLPHRWLYQHDEVGWNYRLPNLNAALGCAQLNRLPDFLARKRRLALRYQRAFLGSDVATFTKEPGDAHSNYWLNTIRLSSGDMAVREAVLDATHHAGYLCRPAWGLLSQLPMYQSCPRGDLSTALQIERTLICLPSGPRLEP